MQAINDKLQGTVAKYLSCGGVVNNQIKKGLLLSLRAKKCDDSAMRYVLLVLWMTSFLHNAQVDHESFTVYVTNQSTSIAAVSSGQQVTRKCIFLPMLQATSTCTCTCTCS